MAYFEESEHLFLEYSARLSVSELEKLLFVL